MGKWLDKFISIDDNMCFDLQNHIVSTASVLSVPNTSISTNKDTPIIKEISNQRTDKTDTEIKKSVLSVSALSILEKLIATIAKYYNYSLEDISDLKEAANKDLNGVINALQKQVGDLNLLRSLGLTWEKVLTVYKQLSLKVCAHMKHNQDMQKKFMDQLNTLTLSGVLNEIVILKKITTKFEKKALPISPWD